MGHTCGSYETSGLGEVKWISIDGHSAAEAVNSPRCSVSTSSGHKPCPSPAASAITQRKAVAWLESTKDAQILFCTMWTSLAFKEGLRGA